MLRSNPPPQPVAAALALGAALCLSPQSARAQDASTAAPAEPAPAELTLARDEFRRGTEAAHAGRWDEALERFTRADALLGHTRPEVLLDLAGAQVETGHLVAGAESYRRFLRDVTSGPLAVHRASAQQTLEGVEARTPHARLVATGLLPSDSLALDGAPLARAVVGAELPVDPGDHALVVTREGTEVAREDFRVAEGETRVVTVAAPPPPPPAVLAPRAQPPPPHPSTARVLRPIAPIARRPPTGLLASPWFWTATSVALVALGVGAGVGAYAATAPQPFHASLGVVRVGP